MSFYEKADAKKMTKQECVVCGHSKQDHIYEEGACRPGFICTANCEKFVALKDDEYSYEKARDSAADNYEEKALMGETASHLVGDAFKEGADWGYIYGRKASSEEIESLAKENTELRSALDEFDNDANWLIESEYIDRKVKTKGSDWIYIGKWDPRVFATHAIKGTPLPNTPHDQRKKLSDAYLPIMEREKEISELKRKLDIAVEALDDAIRNIYGNDMHPFEVERRMSKALAQISAATEENK